MYQRSLQSEANPWKIISALEDKIRIPALPCNILYFRIQWIQPVTAAISLQSSNQLGAAKQQLEEQFDRSTITKKKVCNQIIKFIFISSFFHL